MGLPGDHDLHRHFLIRQDLLQPRQIPEYQRRPFIGGEAPRETDGESVRIQHFLGTLSCRPPERCGRPRWRPRARGQKRPAGVCAADAPPITRSTGMSAVWFHISGSAWPSRQSGCRYWSYRVGQIAVDPTGQMHAIGNGGNGNFPHRKIRPQALPHFLRNVAMQAAHRIAKRRRLNGADRHRKRLVRLRALPRAQAPGIGRREYPARRQ